MAAKRTAAQVANLNADGSIAWQSYSYGQLLDALRNDLQLSAATDLQPSTITAALTADSAAKPSWANYTAPALINSWANAGGGFETAGYLKDPLGFVHLKGLIVGGGNATVAFVLPVSFRPGATTFQSLAVSGPNFGQIEVSTNGNVAIFYVTGPDVGLSGITFLAEN